MNPTDAGGVGLVEDDTKARGGPIKTADEAMVLARVRAGETAAYAELVTRHAPVARRLAVLSGAGSDADDVVQEAFVKAYRSLSSFRDGAEFRPWLLRIVINESRNLHRGQSRRTDRELRVAREDADSSRDRTRQRWPWAKRDVRPCSARSGRCRGCAKS